MPLHSELRSDKRASKQMRAKESLPSLQTPAKAVPRTSRVSGAYINLVTVVLALAWYRQSLVVFLVLMNFALIDASHIRRHALRRQSYARIGHPVFTSHRLNHCFCPSRSAVIIRETYNSKSRRSR